MREKRSKIVSQSMQLSKQPYPSSMMVSEMPDYISKKKVTQEDRDREAKNRLWLYQIDQIEQEALCRE